MPIKWSISIARKSMMEDRFCNPPSYSNLIKAIAEFRKSLTQVLTYGYVPVPLVYTQVRMNTSSTPSLLFMSRLFTWLSTSTSLFLWWENSGFRGRPRKAKLWRKC